MNPSLHSKIFLFAPFPVPSKTASWPTYGRTLTSKGRDSSQFKKAGRLKTISALIIDSSSMSCEAALKSAKKFIKTQNLRIKG